MITPSNIYDKNGSFGLVFRGTAAQMDRVPDGRWSLSQGDLWYDTATDELKVYDGSSWSVVGGTGSAPVFVGDVATYAFLAANTGLPHVVPDLTAKCTFTLPAIAAGLNFELVYGGVAADGQDWDIYAVGEVYLGGVVELDTSGNTVVLEAPNGTTNSIMTVKTPAPGTSIKFLCDGSNWFISGIVHSDTADGVTWSDPP